METQVGQVGKWVWMLALLLNVSAWALPSQAGEPLPSLKVYKSATCGCCSAWIDHAKDKGFKVEAFNVADMNAVKAQYGVAPELQSCHTAISQNGYFFEGHIPARVIHTFLAQPPANARGLTAPGMPMGSPGMEGGQFRPYDILLVRTDGSTSRYTRVESATYD